MIFTSASAAGYDEQDTLIGITAEKKTVVLVSHRVSTMNVADVVYEMENGRIS